MYAVCLCENSLDNFSFFGDFPKCCFASVPTARLNILNRRRIGCCIHLIVVRRAVAFCAQTFWLVNFRAVNNNFLPASNWNSLIVEAILFWANVAPNRFEWHSMNGGASESNNKNKIHHNKLPKDIYFNFIRRTLAITSGNWYKWNNSHFSGLCARTDKRQRWFQDWKRVCV